MPFAAVSSPKVWILVGLRGWYFESGKDCFYWGCAAPYECGGVRVGLRWGSSGVSASAETAPKPPYDNNHKLGYNPLNFGIETTY